MPLVPERRFTDREELRHLFLEMLKTTQSTDDFRLFTLYGVGGQGKSALFNYFQEKGPVDQDGLTFSAWAKQYGELPDYKVAAVDFKDPVFQTNSAAALMELRHRFIGTGIDFFRFDLAFSSYLGAALSKPELAQEYPGLTADDHSLLLDLISLAGSLLPPPAGITLSILTTLGRHIDKLKPKNRIWYQKEGQQLAYELASLSSQALADKLPRYLGQDLTNALKKDETPRLIVMMDTHESLWGKNVSSIELGTQHTDSWIRELVSACPGVLFVIFGRDQLKWDSYSKPQARRNYTAMLENNQYLLEGFSDQDAHVFLKRAGVRQDTFRNAIVSAAEGLPLYLELQAEIYQTILEDGDNPNLSNFGGTLPEVIDRFLRHLSDHQKDTLLIVGQAKQLTKPIFELLKQRFFNGSPVHFAHLVKHSFVQALAQLGQYGFHQLMQEHLHDYLRRDRPDCFTAVHQALFEYYDERAKVEDIKAITPLQETALVEAAYHKSKSDEADFSRWLYEKDNNYSEAARYPLLEPLYRQATEIDKRTFGETHSRYVNGLNNLGVLLKQMGRYEEAELLYRRVIKISEQTNGKLHSAHAIRLNNLGLLRKLVGDYEEAEQLYREAIKIDEQTLDELDPNYATHLSNLANLLTEKKGFEEAELLYQRVMEIDLKAFGEGHREHSTDLNNLANLYRMMERYEKAEPLYRQAIEIDEQTLPELHPQRAVHLNNLALLLRGTSRHEEAERYFRQAIEIAEQNPGKWHRDYAVQLCNLAILLSVDMSRHKEAKPLLQQAYEVFRVTLGKEHPKTRDTLKKYQSTNENCD